MSCLFCKIIAGEIPATRIYDDENIIAFKDIRPQAPTHLLIIPKKHIATIHDVEKEDIELLGRMVLVAKEMASLYRVNEGYRLVYNVNSGGGQEVYHIHLHLLGGRQMLWPPG